MEDKEFRRFMGTINAKLDRILDYLAPLEPTIAEPLHKMARTTVFLHPDQIAWLRREDAISLGEMLRRIIDEKREAK